MRRRDFIRGAVAAVAGAPSIFGLRDAPLAATDAQNQTAGKKLHVEYARQEIAPFELPGLRGRRYEDSVPDTLDIAERARLGVNVLTSITDPDADYEIYWLADFFRQPATLMHDFNDSVQVSEGLMESLPLMRLASGEEMNGPVDRGWMTALLKSVGPDGLVYLPLNGRPWSRLHWSEVDPVWLADGRTTHFDDPSVAQVTSGDYFGRALGVLNVYYALDKNPAWKDIIERMVQRTNDLAVHKGDYASIPSGGLEPNASTAQAPAPQGFLALEVTGRPIQGLCQYYRIANHEQSVVLAGKFARFLRNYSGYYDQEGRWLETEYIRKSFKKYFPDTLKFGGHSHAHAIGLLCLLEYATAAHDKEMLNWVRQSYEWTRDAGSEFGTSSLVGWFPEVYGVNYASCEADTLGDMIPLALKLSAAGTGDYWDDADRWVRNHFAEAQLTEPNWLYEFAAQKPKKPVAANETADRVPERSVGAFAGWASPNEWTVFNGIMHCCTGNCTRALYYVWQHMLDKNDGELRVNLLLNRASTTADVYSYIPFEGRVEVKFKTGVDRLLIRVPEWIKQNSPDVICHANGKPRSLHWEGRYVNLGHAKPSDRVTLSFPISNRTVREKIGIGTYTLELRGTTVVSMNPAGKAGPLYAGREIFSQGQAPLRKVQRFVQDNELHW